MKSKDLTHENWGWGEEELHKAKQTKYKANQTKAKSNKEALPFALEGCQGE